jgi:hypothetical protein
MKAEDVAARWSVMKAEDVERALRDPDQQLRRLQSMLADHKELATQSPVHAWMAIDLCVAYKKPFPDWVIAYLGQCAVRMRSNEARRARDIRKTLLWIFGFPNKKAGPGNPLDPYHGWRERANKMTFAATFARRIRQGEDPVKARSNACNDVSGRMARTIEHCNDTFAKSFGCPISLGPLNNGSLWSVGTCRDEGGLRARAQRGPLTIIATESCKALS